MVHRDNAFDYLKEKERIDLVTIGIEIYRSAWFSLPAVR